MGRKKSWTDEQLKRAVLGSTSIRGVIKRLGLIPAGGNYVQVGKQIDFLGLDTRHFLGRGWNKELKHRLSIEVPLEQLLRRNTTIQSYKLKNKLYKAKLKKPICEFCGWAKKAEDGRIPLELDHINGIKTDNRLSNLRILCPNCHSLQPTHRGLNKKAHYARMME